MKKNLLIADQLEESSGYKGAKAATIPRSLHTCMEMKEFPQLWGRGVQNMTMEGSNHLALRPMTGNVHTFKIKDGPWRDHLQDSIMYKEIRRSPVRPGLWDTQKAFENLVSVYHRAMYK